MNKGLNRKQKVALYALKRHYGSGPLDIYEFRGTTTNTQTGVKVVDKDVHRVHRVIVMPGKVTRDLTQTISMISANKGFVYGGYFDSRTKVFIIERRDVPSLTDLKQDYWVVFNGRKYEIKRIEEFEFDVAWVVTARELIGEKPEQIHQLSAENSLSLEQDGQS